MKKELAYLLGYFYADAHLKDDKYPVLEVMRSDGDNIIKYLDLLKIKYTIRYRFRKNSKKEQVTITVCQDSKYIKIFINTMKNKLSMNKIYNIIKNKDLNYFIRGFFDGDGCINISKNNSCRLYFYGTYEQDWSLIFSIFKNINIKYTYQKIIRKNGKHKSSYLCISNKYGINIFFEYLYQIDYLIVD
jgi:hypothetical protein